MTTYSGKKHIIIGTAGHIDHGKSALIKALTGEDPDRLKEEKERGMTTDLGFVFYGDDVTFIDVPGHEKFVRHMVAGANSIDFVIFVIAADDGVMPQTVEHLEILKLLEIENGFVVITKIDLVDDELLSVVDGDVKTLVKGTFLEGKPIVHVSNTTKKGIDKFKQVLDDMIAKVSAKQDKGIFKLPIDRCFVMKGFGTVVAGTILSGSVRVGETLEILPLKKQVKVRGIQVHNHGVQEATTGFRTAINISGAEKHEIERGDIIAQPGYFSPSEFLNASLYLLSSADKPLKTFTRLRIHIGTKELFGRVVLLERKTLNPGEKAMVQFRMETPAVSDVGDRYVVRTYSPQNTIGGGVIIEPKAEKAKGFDEELLEHLHRMETGEPNALVEEYLLSNYELPQKIDEIAHDVNLPIKQVKTLVQQLSDDGKVICIDTKRGLYYTHANFEKLKGNILTTLSGYHTSFPTNVGMPQLELHKQLGRGLDKSLFDYALRTMKEEKKMKVHSENKVSLYDFEIVLEKGLDEMVKKIEKIFKDAGYKPPDYNALLQSNVGPEQLVKKAYRYLLDSKQLINVGESIVFHKDHVKQAEDDVVQFLEDKKEIKVSEFRDLLGASRKYALPLLIYFDTHNVTIKRGEIRVLGQKYRQ
jgi:selenocysteine-specific elongation factor